MAIEKHGVATEPSPESLLWGLCICAVGLDVLKFEQILLFYSASYFNLGGAWSFVSEGLSPAHPHGDGTMCQRFSLLLTAIDSEKYLGYVICEACKICQTFCLSMTGPKVHNAFR